MENIHLIIILNINIKINSMEIILLILEIYLLVKTMPVFYKLIKKKIIILYSMLNQILDIIIFSIC